MCFAGINIHDRLETVKQFLLGHEALENREP